jgi:hypothetical protein
MDDITKQVRERERERERECEWIEWNKGDVYKVQEEKEKKK